MTPETRFARAGGVDLAYQVFGEGDIDIVGTLGWVSHLEAMWDLPESVRFLERLAGLGRVIWFDKRGTGMSDRIAEPSPLGTLTDDVVAVMDAARVRQAVVLGWLEAGALALSVAARYPERVRAVVAGETLAVAHADEQHPWGLDPQAVEQVAAQIEGGEWGAGTMLAVAAPGVAEVARIRQWWQRMERISATPSMAANMLRTNLSLDMRPLLPAVTCPVLLVHRRDVPLIPTEGMRWLAAHLADARLVELDGADIAVNLSDPDQVCDEIEHFLHGTRTGSRGDLGVRTMLFLDVVGSTAQAARLGDAAWRDLLTHHRAEVRRVLGRYGGIEVDTAGDGCLATFTAPSLALRCAAEAVEVAEQQGIGLRAGVHTAEVRTRADTVVGVGVHVGARIAALAGRGEVAASTAVRDLVLGSGLSFASLGEHELKGVPGRWEVLRLETPRQPRPDIA